MLNYENIHEGLKIHSYKFRFHNSFWYSSLILTQKFNHNY